MSIGVPIKVLHEAEGHTITCETITGETFRGKLIEAEDNMNCQIANVHVTYRDGRTNELDLVFIRGSKIQFLILPDMLKNAPMFKKVGQKGGTGAGVGAGARGKAAMMRGAIRGRGGARGGGTGGRGSGGRGGGSWLGQGPPRGGGGGGRGGAGH